MATLYVLSPKALKFIFDELRSCDSYYKCLPRSVTYGTLSSNGIYSDKFQSIMRDIEEVLSCVAANLVKYDLPLFKGCTIGTRGEDFGELALPASYVTRYEMNWEVVGSDVIYPEEAKVFIGSKLL